MPAPGRAPRVLVLASSPKRTLRPVVQKEKVRRGETPRPGREIARSLAVYAARDDNVCLCLTRKRKLWRRSTGWRQILFGPGSVPTNGRCGFTMTRPQSSAASCSRPASSSTRFPSRGGCPHLTFASTHFSRIIWREMRSVLLMPEKLRVLVFVLRPLRRGGVRRGSLLR